MKRELFEGVAVIPEAVASVSGQVAGALPDGDSKLIDRQGFLSAVLGVAIGDVTGTPKATMISVDILTGDLDDGSDLKPLDDAFAVPLKGGTAQPNELHNIDIDLLGCKRYIKVVPKIAFDGGSAPALDASFALALGDKDFQPV